MKDRSFDFIVVGSGSAGSVVAGRLSEDPGTSVLLIEAGPGDRSIYIQMPAALGVHLSSAKYNWFYYSEPDPGAGGRRIYEGRGKVLGGSSSINGMNWARGNPWDYDNWSDMGVPGWNYAACLPYFKKAEAFHRGADTYRGGSGPMRIETSPAKGALYDAFLESGLQAGQQQVADHNGFRQEGVHVTQRNVGGGIRWSTSQAYLRQAGPRPNLTVLTNTHVTRIEFSGKRAVRVHAVGKGGPLSFEAAREVVLSGGAINTPQLLQLSGIGDGAALKSLDIPLVAHVPGVGRNLMDHPAAAVRYTAKGRVSLARHLSLPGRALVAARWLLFKNGLGNTNYFETGAFLRTNDTLKVPNLQYEFIPLMGDFQDGTVSLSEGFQYFFALMRPTSRGRVWLASADPMAAPKFVFNYLSTEQDQREAVEAVKMTRAIIAQRGWDKYRGVEDAPGKDVQTDEEILAFMRRSIGTQFHPCGSCRMGRDDMSVADENGRVHETDNLRIVDGSLMPQIVSGNLNAPIIMMAEKLVDNIRGRKPLEPENVDYYRL